MILFIGNLLSKQGLNPTAIEDLIKTLSQKYVVECASNKNNLVLRLLDMLARVIVCRNKCKLVVLDVFSTRAILFAISIVSLAKFFKIPYYLVLRGGYLPERYEKQPYIFNFLFSSAKKIISPSKYLQKSFEKTNFSIMVIPNYIDLKKYNFINRREIKPHLFWVRSIHAIYNPIMAINVLIEIRKKYPKACLCIVGPVKDIEVMEHLNSMIHKFSLNNNITFAGQLSKSEWSALSMEYDIFLNTTNYDNNPVSLLEAMALGMPIISTNVGGIPYLIEDNYTGLLVEKNNSVQMANKVYDLISGKINAKEIAENAKKYVSQYDKEKIINQWRLTIDDAVKS